jgi:NADPH:quinone reductase-like Zn-dependent oxidoreductase
MKAFGIERYGDNNQVRELEVGEPRMNPDDVLVEIHAASVNPVDLKIRDGKLKSILPYRMPLILGNDLAGVVAQVGANVRKFKVGDAVYARPDKKRIGTFAERIALQENEVARKPTTLTMEEAAAVPLVGLTAWQALVEKGALRTGQSVLIHAGSGGVGTIAIQLAKHLGARVSTTTGTGNVELVKRLGADRVVDYRKERFEDVLEGHDLILDTLGGEALAKSVRVLNPGGRVVSVAGPPDPTFAREWRLSWVLRLAIFALSFKTRRTLARQGKSYSFLFMRPSGEQLEALSSLIDSGVIRPVIDRVFSFPSTREALAYVESGRAKGKVVIRIK